MKKFLVIILVVITAAGTFIPCCEVDDCCADLIAVHESNKPEGTCSPFFSCATCPSFVEISKPIQLIQPLIEKQVHHEQIIVFNLSTYSNAYWQPPRSC